MDEESLPAALVGYIKTKYPDNPAEAVENYFTKIYYSIYDSENTNEPLKIDYNGDGEPEYCRVSYLSTRKEDMGWVDYSSFGSEQKTIQINLFYVSEIGQYLRVRSYIARIHHNDR